MSDVMTEPSTELDVYAPQPPSLFGTTDPIEVVQHASRVAGALAHVIEEKQLYNTIGRRKHVNVEGWTLLGSMLGVFPVVEWSRPVFDVEADSPVQIGWEARVSVRNMQGLEIGSAEAMCTRKESSWRNRDDYAIRSMAQTRAVSKAMRHPLGFVMTLGGYDPTPEAEMHSEPVQAAPEAARLTRAEFDEVELAVGKAAFFDPDRWGVQNVIATAERVFGRNLDGLHSLTSAEAARIIAGANDAVDKGVAEHATQAANEEPVEEPAEQERGDF